jgi:GNAT superfamily N-acetyltransferase
MMVRTTYLEIRDPVAIRPARRVPADVAMVRALEPSPELNRYFYTAVGGDWHWRDRLGWTWEEWLASIGRPGHETWYLTWRGTPAGYFELDGTAPPDAEITFFGLLPAFAGRGLGGWWLERAIRRGFEVGSRVWLHTCSLDSPAAIPNYLARGMVTFRTEDRDRPVAPPAGPWPGADRPKWSEP